MVRIKLAFRFILALIAFVLLLNPFSTMFVPPDVFTQLIVRGITALVAAPVALLFVRRSHSVERLSGYLISVYVLIFVGFGFVFGLQLAVDTITDAMVQAPDFVWVIAQTFLIIFIYGIAFYLVYRGGYDRLKARLA